MTLRFELPWPPSVNTYWHHSVLGGGDKLLQKLWSLLTGNPRMQAHEIIARAEEDFVKFKKARAMVFLSEQGKRYRTEVIEAIRRQKVPRGAVRGRLGILAVAYPPDERTRDLDNCWKGMLDGLKHAGVIADDGDFDDEHIVRGPKRPGGLVELTVRELGTFNEQASLALEQPTPLSQAFRHAYANEPEPRGLLRAALDRDPF